MNGKIIMIVFVAILIVFCLVLALDIKSAVRTASDRIVTRPSGRRREKAENKFVTKAKKAITKTSNTVPVFAPVLYAKGPEADAFKKYPALKDETTIGRGEDNDVVLKDPAVSEHHGVILKVRDREGFYYVYRNLSKTNPTEYLNQEEKNYEWLDYKDQVYLGEKEGFYIGETKVIIKTPNMGHKPEKDDLSEPKAKKTENSQKTEMPEMDDMNEDSGNTADVTRHATKRSLDRDDVYNCL